MEKRANMMRILLGGLTALLGIGGLAWVCLMFSAEYSFRRITQETREEGLSHQALVSYEINLGKLTHRDPTNGEIRNMHASVLGKLGDYGQAVRQLEIARKTLNTRNSLYFLSDMYEKMNDIPRAEAMMADCLLINPTDSEFNPARLHLLMTRLYELNTARLKGQLKDMTELNRYRREFGQAALNWGIRASNDKNSFLFMANFYVDPLYALEAYRNFLVGISGASWLNLNQRAMIDLRGVMLTIQKIMAGHYAKPYRNLP